MDGCESGGCGSSNKIPRNFVQDYEEDAEWIAEYRRRNNCSLHEAKQEYVYRQMLAQIDTLEHESDQLKDVLKGMACWLHSKV